PLLLVVAAAEGFFGALEELAEQPHTGLAHGAGDAAERARAAVAVADAAGRRGCGVAARLVAHLHEHRPALLTIGVGRRRLVAEIAHQPRAGALLRMHVQVAEVAAHGEHHDHDQPFDHALNLLDAAGCVEASHERAARPRLNQTVTLK